MQSGYVTSNLESAGALLACCRPPSAVLQGAIAPGRTRRPSSCGATHGPLGESNSACEPAAAGGRASAAACCKGALVGPCCFSGRPRLPVNCQHLGSGRIRDASERLICICHRLCWTLRHMPYVCPPAPAPRLLVSPVLLSYKRLSRVDTGRGRWSRPGVRMKGQRMWYKRGKQAVAQTHGGMETACTFVSCAETCGRWGHADATRLKKIPAKTAHGC